MYSIALTVPSNAKSAFRRWPGIESPRGERRSRWSGQPFAPPPVPAPGLKPPPKPVVDPSVITVAFTLPPLVAPMTRMVSPAFRLDTFEVEVLLTVVLLDVHQGWA